MDPSGCGVVSRGGGGRGGAPDPVYKTNTYQWPASSSQQHNLECTREEVYPVSLLQTPLEYGHNSRWGRTHSTARCLYNIHKSFIYRLKDLKYPQRGFSLPAVILQTLLIQIKMERNIKYFLLEQCMGIKMYFMRMVIGRVKSYPYCFPYYRLAKNRQD